MNDSLNHLYQEVIIDHGRRPRNCKKLETPTHNLEGFNPLCGDRLTVYLQVQDDVIIDLSFEGAGCAISMASASLMTEHLKGKSTQEAEQIFADFRQLVTQGTGSKDEQLGKLIILSGVREYPTRVKCATLAWHTMHGALHQETKTATTEK